MLKSVTKILAISSGYFNIFVGIGLAESYLSPINNFYVKCIKCDVHHVALYNDRNSGFLKLRREPSFWCFNRNRNIEFCV